MIGPHAPKAYNNTEFLNSRSARNIRIQCELDEPAARLTKEGVESVIMCFGSARAIHPSEYDDALAKAQAKVNEVQSLEPESEERLEAESELIKVQRKERLLENYQKMYEFSKILGEWLVQTRTDTVIASGGGPGIMLAANEGARAAGARSAGFGVSLPKEQGCNICVDENLRFQFHYFFTRKFWMAYKLEAICVGIGGFGTLDELFEVMTLIQTRKIKKQVPIVLLGATFWKNVINWQLLIDHGVVNDADASYFFITDSPQEAADYIKKHAVFDTLGTSTVK